MDQRVKPLYDTIFTAIGCKNNTKVPIDTLQTILQTAILQLTLVPDNVFREELQKELNKTLLEVKTAKYSKVSTLSENVWTALLEVLAKVHTFEQPILQKQETYLGCSKKVYTKEYLKDKEHFRSMHFLINDTEDKLLASPEYNTLYHGVLNLVPPSFAKFRLCRHGRINSNLRIIYQEDREKNSVFFYRIVKHDEIDLH